MNDNPHDPANPPKWLDVGNPDGTKLAHGCSPIIYTDKGWRPFFVPANPQRSELIPRDAR